jgi:hypothetical protein
MGTSNTSKNSEPDFKVLTGTSHNSESIFQRIQFGIKSYYLLNSIYKNLCQLTGGQYLPTRRKSKKKLKFEKNDCQFLLGQKNIC